MDYLSVGAVVGRTPRSPGPALEPCEAESACRFIESLVAAAFGVELGAIRSGGRGRAGAARARQVAMYLAHVCLGMCLSRVGEHFGRDRTTVAYGCARTEDRRDDPGADRVLACLESALLQWRDSVVLGTCRER